MFLGVPGCSWVLLGTPGRLLGCSWMVLWVLLGAPGYSWVLLGAAGCPWLLLGAPGCHFASFIMLEF